MPAPLHITPGDRYGRLVVVAEAPKRRKMRHFLCRCDCGNTITTRLSALRNGKSKSCGCLRVEQNRTANLTHGLSHRPLYRTWHGMKQRCLNPNAVAYEHYGGRGITICDEWLEYEPFHRWALANGYRKGLSIERIDVDGNYEPSNCTWIARNRQTENTRRSRPVTFRGETKILKHWARDLGLPAKLLRNRLNRGWSVEKAFSTPLDVSRSHPKKG